MNIYEKLAAVQQDVKAPKNQKNAHMKFNYRSAEGILEAVKPSLLKQKATIVLTDEIVDIGGRIYVKASASFIDIEATEGKNVWWTEDQEGTEVEHSVPEWSIHIPLTVTAYAREADSKAGLDVAQVTGSASSYARKYALSGLLLLDDAKQDPDTEENTRRNEEKQFATEAQIKTIRILAEKAGLDVNAITSKPLEDFTVSEAAEMLLRLRGKIGD